MANWICIKDAAQKYGTTEEKIRELIRLRYVAFSYVDDNRLGGDYEDKLLMIDADRINMQLDVNVVAVLKEGEEESPVVRIPLNELNDLLEIHDQLREENHALSHELDFARKGRRLYRTVLILLILSISLVLYIRS